MSYYGNAKGRYRQGVFFLAGACALGVLAQGAAGAAPGTVGLLVVLAVAAGVLALGAGRTRGAAAAVILSFAALGAYAASLSAAPAPDSISRIVGAEGALEPGSALSFRGTVFDLVRGDEDDSEAAKRYVLELRALAVNDRFRPVSGKVLLDTRAAVPWGTSVEGKARFYPLERPGNPGQFDYAAYLKRQGVQCQARAPAEGLIKLRGRESGHGSRRAVAAVRRAFSRRLQRLDLVRLGVIPAVLLGDRSGLAPRHREDFTRSGTMHLLAISGLHLGVVVGFIWWIMRIAGVSLRGASIVAICAAAAYALLAGARPPVVRAAVMTGMLCLGVLISRRALMLSVVSTAALLMLLYRPLDIYGAGFQMSFAAVLGLWYLGRPLSRWFKGLLGEADFRFAAWLRGILGILGWSVGAWLGATPLAAYHFHIVSLVSPLANLVLIPVTSAMVIAGLLASALSVVKIEVGALAGLSAAGAETTLVAAAGVLARIPGSHVYIGTLPGWWVAAAYGFLAACGAVAAAHRRTAPLVVAGLVAVNLVLWGHLLLGAPAPPTIQMLTAYGKSAVVAFDGRGSAAVFVGRDADEFFASAVICPFLVARGCPKVDLLVETAGADARIRDVLRESLALGKVLRQRRFRSEPVSGGEGEAEYFGPGDAVRGPGEMAVEFHSARAKDFEHPEKPYFEGLICQLEMEGKRAVMVIDAGPGALRAVSGKIRGEPEALCVVSYGGSRDVLDRWRADLSPRVVVAVDPAQSPPPRSVRILLGKTPEWEVFEP